jgi:hypothetical protein
MFLALVGTLARIGVARVIADRVNTGGVVSSVVAPSGWAGSAHVAEHVLVELAYSGRARLLYNVVAARSTDNRSTLVSRCADAPTVPAFLRSIAGVSIWIHMPAVIGHIGLAVVARRFWLDEEGAAPVLKQRRK